MTLKEFCKKWLGQKHDPGTIDCFKIIFDYLKDRIELPTEFEGLTLETYPQAWLDNPENVLKIMYRFFEQYLVEKETYQFMPGDILVIESPLMPLPTPAIYVDNTHVLLVTHKQGVGIFSLHSCKILRCFT